MYFIYIYIYILYNYIILHCICFFNNLCHLNFQTARLLLNCGGLYAHNYACAAMATETPLRLGCSDAIPRTCDREYEKRRKCRVGDHIRLFPHLLNKTSRSLKIPITTSICLTFRPSFCAAVRLCHIMLAFF